MVVEAIENESSIVEFQDRQICTNFNQALKVMASEPIQIKNEESAKERILQWISQKNHMKQVELTTKAYKLYHRMSLIYIYDELHILAVEQYPNSKKKQRKFERDIMCAQLAIHIRTERRRKKSAIRIRKLINIGITFEQLVNVGLTVSNFEVSNNYYDIFLTDLKLDAIKNLFQKPANSLSNIQNMDLDTEDSEKSESDIDGNSVMV